MHDAPAPRPEAGTPEADDDGAGMTAKKLRAFLADAPDDAVVVVDVGKTWTKPVLYADLFRGYASEANDQLVYRLGGSTARLVVLKI